MPSALSHDPAITVPGASTDNAIVIFDGTGGTGFGNSTIVVDSGGNGRIGLATDTNLITLTNETVAVAGAITGVTALTVDNININGNTISSTAGTDLLITPLSGQQIVLDGTIIIDAGVATAATSITSTEFVGGGVGLTALNGTQITSGTLPAARIAGDSIVEGKLNVSNGPSNGYLLTARNGVAGGFTWEAAATADVVDDTTPQLGAHLDMNQFGLDFSSQADSADADVFDDYEEGTFSPTIVDSSISDSESQTYSNQAGFYTKIGNMCLFQFSLVITSFGSLTTSQVGKINNLPFATSVRASFVCGQATSLNSTAGYNLTGDSAAGQPYFAVTQWDSAGGGTGMILSKISSDANLHFSGHYKV